MILRADWDVSLHARQAVRRADGQAYALKVVKLRLSSIQLKSMLNEVRLLCSFRHNRLLRCFEAFIGEHFS